MALFRDPSSSSARHPLAAGSEPPPAAPPGDAPLVHGAQQRAQPSPAPDATRHTLERHAATGGMTPDRVRGILADLTAGLAELHRTGRAHGDIAPATIVLDETGRARLLTRPLQCPLNADDAPRRAGYAAFEQYTDDPDTPCGPWTDVYALCATACALMTGSPPPAALARCVIDDYVPLAQRHGPQEQAFCAVIDQGLALDPHARPRTVEALAEALQLVPRGAAAVPAAAAAVPAAAMPAAAAPSAAHAPTASPAAMAPSATAAVAPDRPVSPAARAIPVATELADAAGAPGNGDGDGGVARVQRLGTGTGGPEGRKRPALLAALAVAAAAALAFYVWLRHTPDTPPPIVAATETRADAVPRAPAPDAMQAPAAMAEGRIGADATGLPNAAGPAERVTSATQAPPVSATGIVEGASIAANAPPSASPGPMAATPASQGPAAADLNPTNPTNPANPPHLANPAPPMQTASAGAPAESGIPSPAPAPTATSPAKLSQTAGAPAARPPSKTPVAVSVSIRPWGEILVDGRSRGVSPPLNSLSLPPGEHRITLRNNANPDFHMTLTVKPGQPASISHTFQ